MKVGLKLNLAFYSIIGLMIITAIVVFINLNTIESREEDALDYRVEQIRLVEEIRSNIAFQGLYARELIIENSASNKEKLVMYAEELDKEIELMSSMVSSDTMKAYVEEMKVHNDLFNEGLEELFTSLTRNNIEASKAILNNT